MAAEDLTATSRSERRQGAGQWKIFRRDHKPFDRDVVDEIARAIIPDAAITTDIADGRLCIEADLDAVIVTLCPVDAAEGARE